MKPLSDQNDSSAVGARSANSLNQAAVDYVLTTTRVVRKRLDLDQPVAREIIEDAIRVAVQAPTADDLPRWHWYVIDDPEVKGQLKKAQQQYEIHSESAKFSGDAVATYREMVESIGATNRLQTRLSGVQRLVENLERIPAIVIVALQNPVPLEEIPATDINGPTMLLSSILPAAWSFHLALRARGLVSAWTSYLLNTPECVWRVRELLGMPPDHHPVATFPVGHPLGGTDFPSAGRGTEGIIHWNADSAAG
ncbi:nitroreductase family protein [Mycobacteroides abscessus]|uniref:nitroreductase family protein n=1 Tax=Mycobacteroides abscessus TaxID=36809 RepID=UPI000C2602F2|nr:nitroreductase family protein [Mycobacteroides abscessus]